MAIGSHIIPRFYLEQFSVPSERKDGPGRVWVYERGSEPDQRGTTVQGRENGYFEYVRPDGTREETLENKLADMEGECNEALACAKSELFDWSLIAKSRLAFYAAMLFCRATQRRNFNQTNWANIWKEFSQAVNDDDFLNEMAEHYNRQFNTAVNVASLRARLLELVDSMKSAAESKNAFLRDFLSHADIIKELLLQKPWRPWKAQPQAEFITSDNPVISFVPVGNGELSPGYGFRYPGVVVAFPLAPSTCLAMGDLRPELYRLDISGIAKINEIIVRSCDKYVYSKTYSDRIKEMVNEFGGTATYGVTTHLPLGLKLPKVKEFIRRSLGLDGISADS
jgi:hypothetical protein